MWFLTLGMRKVNHRDSRVGRFGRMVGVMQGFDVRGRPLHPGELAAWLSEHSLGSRFGLGVVDTGQGNRSMATGLAIVAADGDARHIDPADLIPEDSAALA